MTLANAAAVPMEARDPEFRYPQWCKRGYPFGNLDWVFVGR